MNAAVSDASPLIILAKADLLEILPKLFSTIFLPRAVRAEIDREKSMIRCVRSWAAALNWWTLSCPHRFPLSPIGSWGPVSLRLSNMHDSTRRWWRCWTTGLHDEQQKH